MKGGKFKIEERTFFFFFFLLFSLFKTTEICFGCTKMKIFYWEKEFHTTGKKGKMTIAPSEIYSSYAPALDAVSNMEIDQDNPVVASV